MSCNCELLQKRLEKLQKKYAALRKNHKKLLGVTALLTDTLEDYIKGDVQTEITETLLACSALYPDLFENTNHLTEESHENEKNTAGTGFEKGKVYEPATESEREYFEGFWSRPRIPRTPQV